MSGRRFTIDRAIGYTSRKFMQEIIFLLGVMVLIGFLFYAPAVLAFFLERNPDQPTYVTAFIVLLFFPLQLLVQMGLMKIAVDLYDGKPLDLAALYRSYPHLLNFFAASLLYGLIVLGGLLLLVVPAVIWAVRFQFFGFFIVDKGYGPLRALKASYAVTRGETGYLFLFGLLVLLLQIASIGVFYIGPIIGEVFVAIGLAYVYRKLLYSRTA